MLIPFKELFHRYNITSKAVVHLGANTGQEAEAYAAQGVQTVIWVEALKPVFRELVRHVSKFPNSIPLLAVLGERDGEDVLFHIASNCGQSSSYLDFGTHTKEHPNVTYVGHEKRTTTRLDTLLRNHNLELEGDNWFLNIDLQGAELLALKGAGELMKHFRHAYIEVNEKELYKGCPRAREIDAFMADWGFVAKETKMTNFGWGDRYYRKENATLNNNHTILEPAVAAGTVDPHH